MLSRQRNELGAKIALQIDFEQKNIPLIQEDFLSPNFNKKNETKPQQLHINILERQVTHYV
jgi:hypothetical protein